MSRAVEDRPPLSPARRVVPLVVACCLAVAAGAAAQERETTTAPADPPPAAASQDAAAPQAAAAPPGTVAVTPPAAVVQPPAAVVPVTPPLPIDLVVVRPRPEAPAAARPPQTISLSLRDADLVEVLRSFAHLGGFNLVVDPSVKGTVTVELRDVRWENALAVILRTHGLAAEIDGELVSIRPLPVASGR